MSDFGLFESDEAAANEPRRQARTAARKLDAAIDTVRANFGRFLLGATGIDEFEDRWHLSKNDIRASVEPMVFPNTGTMRRIQNAMKSDWKLAHPYKLAIDHDDAGFGSMPEGDSHRNQDLDETYSPSSGNLIPEDRFESWKDSVDQDGPEKVSGNDFTPGGDSGSDKHARIDREAAMLVADIYTDFARSNGLRVASMRSLDAYASTGIAEADYRILANLIRIAEEEAEACDDEDEDTDSEAPEASESDESDSDDDEGDDYDFGGEDAAEDDTDDDGDHDDDDHHDFGDTDSDGDHDDDDHHDGGEDDYDFGGDEGGDVSQTFTVPEHAPELDPQMLNEIPHDDTDGSAPVPPEVIDSLLGLPEGTIEQLLLEEVEQGQGGSDGYGAPPQGGGDQFGGAPQGGGDDFLGEGGDDAEQEPPRVARRRQAVAPLDDDEREERRRQRFLDKVDRKHQKWLEENDGPDENGRYQNHDESDQWGGSAPEWDMRARNARRFWAAEGDEQPAEGGGGGEQQAAPAQDPAAAMGGGMQQPMMPPPGSGAVAPPAPPQQLENQPAEDALLDTANQAIMQMIDQETAEYQQIIDPLSQALQAIQFAQQVEQAEHPMDVTPPEGTVNVDPSQAPGGQPPMQQQARRQASGWEHRFKPYPDNDEPDWEAMTPREREEVKEYFKNNPPHEGKKRAVLKNAARRQAKVEFGIRNAAALIASRYRLSATGHQMLLNAALGRRGYEHVVEALKLVPAEVRQAAAIHMSHLFAAGNQRFNKDVFMKTVMAGTSKDRYENSSYTGPRDKRRDEHGRQDMADAQAEDEQNHWEDDPDYRKLYQGSRGRLPFDRPRLAGETWTNTPTKDAFEFPNAGEVARVDDNNDTNNLPPMKGADPHGKNAASEKAVDRFQRWQKSQQQRGLPTTQGESAVHNFLQTHNPIKKRVGPEAADMIHRELGLNPDSVKIPRAKPVKAVNPTLKGKGGKTPAAPTAKTPTPKAAPKTATWGEWEPTNQPSFFTRKVAGWRWDDHLSGYISKEARDFACSCGEKVASPSYQTCKCGKIWNVYAIGDSHHLASDTADVYIAREIEVRPGVIMANRKMAGEESTWQLPENSPDKPSKPGKPKNYFATGPCGQCGGRVHDDSTFGGDPICENCLDEVYGEAGQPPPSADGWNPDDKQDPFDPRLIGANRKMAGAHPDEFYPKVPGYTNPGARRLQQILRDNRGNRPVNAIQGIPADADYYLEQGDPHTAWVLQKEKQHGKPLSQFTEDDWAIAGDPPPRKAHRVTAKDGDCTCWEGYERVPGTEPCASGSCRKKTSSARAQATFKQYLAEINRLAADNSGSPYNPGVGSGVIPDTKYFPTNTPGAGGIGADRVNKGGQFNDGIKIDTSNVQIDEAPPMPDKTIGVGVDGFGKPDKSVGGVGRMNSDNTLFGGGGSFGDASTATPQPPSGFNGTPSLLPGKTAYADNLAMIEKLADWTKYDSPDPSRDSKAKPPSTKIKSQPGDWTNRDFTGPTKGQWREPDPTELPRKTRKKK